MGRKKKRIKIDKGKAKQRYTSFKGRRKLFAGFSDEKKYICNEQEQERLLFSFKKDEFHNRISARKLLEKFNFLQNADSDLKCQVLRTFLSEPAIFSWFKSNWSIQFKSWTNQFSFISFFFFSFSRDFILCAHILMHRRFGFKIVVLNIESRRSNCKRHWHRPLYHRAMEWCEIFKDTACHEAINHIRTQIRLTDIHK